MTTRMPSRRLASTVAIAAFALVHYSCTNWSEYRPADNSYKVEMPLPGSTLTGEIPTDEGDIQILGTHSETWRLEDGFRRSFFSVVKGDLPAGSEPARVVEGAVKALLETTPGEVVSKTAEARGRCVGTILRKESSAGSVVQALVCATDVHLFQVAAVGGDNEESQNERERFIGSFALVDAP